MRTVAGRAIKNAVSMSKAVGVTLNVLFAVF